MRVCIGRPRILTFLLVQKGAQKRLQLRREFFSSPTCNLGRGRGPPAWSERRTLAGFTTGARFRSKSARLFACGLAVMARRTQRTQMLRSIRIRGTLCEQLLSRQREMVGNRRATTAQHTPRVRVQVRAADARPHGPVCTRSWRHALRGRFPLMGRTASARGQLGAAGDRTGGTGFARHGVLMTETRKPRLSRPGILWCGLINGDHRALRE